MFRSADFIVALVASAIAVGALAAVPSEVGGESLAAIANMNSPAFFPILAACVMLLSAGGLALKAAKDSRGGAGLRVELRRRGMVAAVMGVFIFFTAATYFLGMLIAAVATILLMASLLGYRKPWPLICVALLVPAAVYLLFERTLLILLPGGQVFQ